MSYTIREARSEDAAAILTLIKALAVYEKEPDVVFATVEDILRDGFGPNPLFLCLLAECDGQVGGFCLYFNKWSSWTGRGSLHLEDLFVDPQFRGRGLGLGLLRRLAKVTVEKGFQRFEWEVLDWNTLARDFYHNLGARHKEGWYPYRLEGDALLQLANSGDENA